MTAGMPLRARMRAAWRREVLALCAVALLADVIAGIVMPTFSLYAEELGASLVLIGALTTLSGLAQLLSSFPIGVLSDRVGRQRVLLIGVASFVLAMLLFALAPSAWYLVPGRLILGLAMVATFWIAAAYMGDIVAGAERGIAFGLLTTAMGIGFTIGPLIGGQIAEASGTRASYLFAAAVGVAGVAVVLTLLPRSRPASSTPQPSVAVAIRASLRLARDRNLVAASIASLLTGVGFSGAIAAFFPLYGDEIGLSEATIGAIFAVRAAASAVARLPSGLLVGAIGSRPVLLGAVVLEGVAILGVGLTERTAALYLLLAVEGVAFGAYLTSGHAFVAEHSVAETRGAAIGLYSTAGSLGGTLAPIGLGLIGRALGLPAVFVATAALFGVGLATLAWMSVLTRSAQRGVRSGEMTIEGGEA
jgi:MFS family permease